MSDGAVWSALVVGVVLGGCPDGGGVGGFGLFDGEDAGELLVGDVDGGDRVGEDGAVGMCEEEDGFVGVVDVG